MRRKISFGLGLDKPQLTYFITLRPEGPRGVTEPQLSTNKPENLSPKL